MILTKAKIIIPALLVVALGLSVTSFGRGIISKEDHKNDIYVQAVTTSSRPPFDVSVEIRSITLRSRIFFTIKGNTDTPYELAIPYQAKYGQISVEVQATTEFDYKAKFRMATCVAYVSGNRIAEKHAKVTKEVPYNKAHCFGTYPK